MIKQIKNKVQAITVGDIIETTVDPFIVGEVSSVLENKRETVEVIVFDKRLKPLQTYEGQFKIRKARKKDCKHYDFKTARETNNFEIGDIIQKIYLSGQKRYGVVVGFLHPDSLMSNSYFGGYNGIDFLECVEISKKGLQRKRNNDHTLKRFNTSKDNCIICRIDPWHRKGLKLIINNTII